MFNKSPFGDTSTQVMQLGDVDLVFVADAFADQYQGGAELSTEALIESVPDGMGIGRLLSSQVTMDMLQKHQDKFWVFFNIGALDWQLIPTIIANLQYAVVEYDYKYCKWRSPEKHLSVEGVECNCHEEMQGKLYSSLLLGAKKTFWMSEAQEQRYASLFPFLSGADTQVLSSVFNDEFFAKIKALREAREDVSDKWIVLSSPSWIKGRDEAIKVAEEKGYEVEEVWGLSYDDMLEKLASSKGLIFHPLGADTCPRVVIEAKLLGLELDLNDNVQHKDEEWFATDNLLDIESYLYAAREVFWNAIKYHMNYVPTVSGYTTTYDCDKSGYPWRESIDSLLAFCDEVVVVDAGSSDGTWEWLQQWSEEEPRLVVHQHLVDWDSPDWAPQSDGWQKARARDLCTMEFCWQQDVDEVVPAGSKEKIVNLCRHFPKAVDIVDLPVVEYWGSKDKVRVDINPWKWRLSRNKPHITHGIPRSLRQEREDGTVYALPGTDSCDYINRVSGDQMPHAGFYDQNVHQVRIAALQGNSDALKMYEDWFQRAVDSLPGVVHYSWIDIPRKLRMYRDHWSGFWQSLYGQEVEDTAETNMVFDKPWSEVTEQEIEEMGARLANETGGHVFHTKVDLSRPMPHVKIEVAA